MRIKILVASGATAVIAAIGLLVFADKAALAKLDDMGVRYESLERGLFSRVFHKVQFEGMRAERIHANLLSPKKALISGLRVSVDPESGANQLGADGPSKLPTDLNATLRGVDLYWGQTPLFTELTGELSQGQLFLTGEGIQITSGEDALKLDWDGALNWKGLQSEASLQLERGGRLKINIELPGFSLDHPILHSKPLMFEEGKILLEGDRLAKRLHGKIQVDGVEVDLDIERNQRSFSGSATLGPDPVADLLQPLHDVIPEAKKANIAGSFSSQLQFQWPDYTWTADFDLTDLDVDGAISSTHALRRGSFQHRISDEEGAPILRESGEGSLRWTPLREIAPSVGHAIIAAEDIRFTEHSGYDNDSMRDALKANQEAKKIARGGSTLSQQLAKNLYLDGQRTLVRKIRELLIAVEIDRALGKGRILELYLNVVEWGPGIYGIREAAERYFMRRPGQLRPNEAAFLAAILPSPRRFYREQYLREKARETRIDWILQNMGHAGRLSPDAVAQWTKAPLRFVPPPSFPTQRE